MADEEQHEKQHVKLEWCAEHNFRWRAGEGECRLCAARRDNAKQPSTPAVDQGAPVMRQPLPVHGYTAQSDSRVELVNDNKALEERVLRRLDELKVLNVDQRWLAVGRTHIEQAFMAINRAVFQPQRVKLPEDDAK